MVGLSGICMVVGASARPAFPVPFSQDTLFFSAFRRWHSSDGALVDVKRQTHGGLKKIAHSATHFSGLEGKDFIVQVLLFLLSLSSDVPPLSSFCLILGVPCVFVMYQHGLGGIHGFWAWEIYLFNL
jgi:hypothetical protein